MIDPIAIGQTIRHVSKYDKAENPTVWLIGAIDSMQKAQIQSTFIQVNEVEGKTKLSRAPMDQDFEILRHGLKGFENFKGEFKTEKMRFFDREIEVCSFDTLKIIPLKIIRELANIIWEENHVSEELVKN